MQPDLHKRHYFINKYNKQHTTFCRRSNENNSSVDSEDSVQGGVFTLQNKNSGMEITPEKSETMSFLGQGLVRCKSVVDNKCLYQLQYCKQLGWEIYYENEKIQ